jgi:hypothetical protein
MSLAAELRARLLEKADRARAPAMQAYMKSAMPYMGVASADIRRTARAVSAGLEYSTADDWRADILAIWRGAHYREEYYAAIELAGMRYARPFQRMDALPMYREMIESGGWWDIDRRHCPAIGCWDILEAARDAMRETMLTLGGGRQYVGPAQRDPCANCMRRRRWTSICSTPVLSRRSLQKNSSCAKRLAGCCAIMRAPIRTRCKRYVSIE